MPIHINAMLPGNSYTVGVMGIMGIMRVMRVMGVMGVIRLLQTFLHSPERLSYKAARFL